MLKIIKNWQDRRKKRQESFKTLAIMLNSSGGTGVIPCAITVIKKYCENEDCYMIVECSEVRSVFRVSEAAYNKYSEGGVVKFFDLAAPDDTIKLT